MLLIQLRSGVKLNLVILQSKKRWCCGFNISWHRYSIAVNPIMTALVQLSKELLQLNTSSHILHNSKPNHDSVRATFEVMTSTLTTQNAWCNSLLVRYCQHKHDSKQKRFNIVLERYFLKIQAVLQKIAAKK